jgi:hypothetical protein
MLRDLAENCRWRQRYSGQIQSNIGTATTRTTTSSGKPMRQ